MSAVAAGPTQFTDRRRRADELAARYAYAVEPLRLYRALQEPQARAFERATADAPGPAELAAYVVRASLPGVMDATMSEGTELLREAVLLRFHGGDLEGIVRAWLGGEPQPETDAFLARAAAGPVLEALPAVAATLRGGEDERRCPTCGGLPQVAIFADTGESLLTAQRRLACSRCATEWTYARLTCPSCRESGGANLPIFEDVERIPHLRIDACDVCRSYLVTVDVRKDARAVPLVDEIAALPLDLIASERGYTKISRNLMGY